MFFFYYSNNCIKIEIYIEKYKIFIKYLFKGDLKGKVEEKIVFNGE